jgi:DNA-binding MarR family transcriptional regulator
MKRQSDLTAHSTGLLQGTAYSRLHTNLTNVLLQFDLSIPEWKLLGQLYDNGNVRLAELADLLSYDPPMVTKLAKSLEKKGMLSREQDSTDERAKIIVLSKNAEKLLRHIDPIVKKKLGEILRGVTQEELKAYIKVLTVIVNNTQ